MTATLDREYTLAAWDTLTNTDDLSSTTVNPHSEDFDLEVFKAYFRLNYGDSGFVYLPATPTCYIPNSWWSSSPSAVTGVLSPEDDNSVKSKPVSARASVLREAETLISGDRNHTYGEPTQNFSNIGELWTVRLRHKLKDGEVLTAHDVADLQILLKVARNIANTKRDNAVDIAGYAACGWEAYESDAD